MVLPCQLVPRMAAAVQVGSSDGCAVNGMVRSFQPIHFERRVELFYENSSMEFWEGGGGRG